MRIFKGKGECNAVVEHDYDRGKNAIKITIHGDAEDIEWDFPDVYRVLKLHDFDVRE